MQLLQEVNRVVFNRWQSLMSPCKPHFEIPNLKQKSGDLLECFTALPFSTVYNILLCLHIFSVHITHQNKKRNYENLDQLSFDNKRGPKVYLHGQCTPPTNFPKQQLVSSQPITSQPRNAPLLVARVFFFSFYFEAFSYDFNEEWFCYGKNYNFRNKKEKRKKNVQMNSVPLLAFYFFTSFNNRSACSQDNTHTKKKKNKNRQCGTKILSQKLLLPVLPRFQPFLLEGKRTTLTPLHPFLVPGCIDLVLLPT